MKERLLLLVILSLLLSSVAVAANDPSLVLYFPFDEGKGDIANDASGNNNNGKLIENPKWVEGKYGFALEFSGTENKNHVEVPDNPSFNPQKEITCMAWIYFGKWEPTGGIISKYTGAGNQRSYDIHMHHDRNLSFTSGCSSNGAFQVGVSTTEASTPAGTLKEGTWQHVAMTFKAEEFLRLYLDGEMAAESDASATDHLFDNNTPFMVGTDFAIGGAHNGQPREFTGIIDEVAVFSKALSDTEIKQAMKSIMEIELKGKIAALWGRLKRITNYELRITN